MDTDMKLSDFAEIKELLKVLEENGLLKEKEDVSSLVGYIERMETKLSEMNSELQDMHGEVSKIRDGTIKAKCAQLMAKTEEKLIQAKQVVRTCKNNLIISARNAITTFREKGKEALVSAVNAMRIPAALDAMKNGFRKAAESMRGNAEKLDAVREELHEVGFHLGNVGRALIGKPTKESEQLKRDKGILAKVRNFLQKSGAKFSEMEKGAGELSSKLRSSYEKQNSVKSELKALKSAKKETKSKAPLLKDKVL